MTDSIFKKIRGKVVALAAVALLFCGNASGVGDSPISGLRLTSPADGGWYGFTNLGLVVCSNLVSTNIQVQSLTLGGVTQTNWTSGGVWGMITGTLSNQTDLWIQLTNRYTKAEINGFGYLTNIPSYYVTNGQDRVAFGSMGFGVFSNASSSPVPVWLGSSKIWDWAWNAVYPKVPVFANDGSALAPVYAFDYDNTVGMYRYGNGTIGFAAYGTNTFRIDSTGATVIGSISATGGFWDNGVRVVTNPIAGAISVLDTQAWWAAYAASTNTAIIGGSAPGFMYADANTNLSYSLAPLTNNASGVNFGSLNIGSNLVVYNQSITVSNAQNTVILNTKNSLQSSTNLHNNSTLMGQDVQYNAGGNENSAYGYRALISSSGNYLVGVGGQAGGYSAGDYNTSVGDMAGYYCAGSGNTYLGYQAGYRSGGKSNIVIGMNAGRQDPDTGLTDMYTNMIVIGVNVKPKGSATIAIGMPFQTTYIDGSLVVSNSVTSGGFYSTNSPASNNWMVNYQTMTNWVATSGTSSNSMLLGGLTVEEVMAVGATYHFTTNEISYGSVTGRTASLTPPSVSQTATYTGPVTNGQYFASYMIPSNEMPAILEVGTYVFTFYGGHATDVNKDPTIMGDFYVMNTNGTVVQEFESLPVVIPFGTNQMFQIKVTVTNAYPRDSYAFLLRTKLIDADGYTGNYVSQFGRPYYPSFTMSKASGVFVSYADWNAVTPYRVNWNSNNTYSAGTTQFMAMAQVTNNATTGQQVVNYQTMTNWVMGQGYLTNGQSGVNFASLTVGGNNVLTNYTETDPIWGGVSNQYQRLLMPVSDQPTDYNVQLGDAGKTFTISAAVNASFFLPSVSATDVGTTYTFVKLSSGTLIIDAADSDIIADSGAGGTLSDTTAAETYATVTLRLVSETQWVIIGGHGTWSTSP